MTWVLEATNDLLWRASYAND